MSRKAYCGCGNELVTDEEQAVGYCEVCIDNADTDTQEQNEERRHPDE